jgi:hypothetical protein
MLRKTEHVVADTDGNEASYSKRARALNSLPEQASENAPSPFVAKKHTAHR